MALVVFSLTFFGVTNPVIRRSADPITPDAATSVARRVKVGVVLFAPYGTPRQVGSVPAPCTQVPLGPAAYAGYDQRYFEDMGACVRDYYLENSYDHLVLDFATVAGWVQSQDPRQDMDYYAGVAKGSTQRLKADGSDNGRSLLNDAVIAKGLNPVDYDIVIVVHSGRSMQKASQWLATTGQNQRLAYTYINSQSWSTQMILSSGFRTSIAIVLSESDPVGYWAHELSHSLGRLINFDKGISDEFVDGMPVAMALNWSLMATGNNNGGQYDAYNWGDGTNPAPLTSYGRQYFGWLKSDIHCLGERGVFSAPTLEATVYGDSVLRFNLQDINGGEACRAPSFPEYLLIEGRYRDVPMMLWGESWPRVFGTDGLVIYGVNDTLKVNTATKSRVTIMGYVNKDQPVYVDLAAKLKFTYVAPSGGWSGRSYVDVQPYTESSFSGHYRGGAAEAVLGAAESAPKLPLAAVTVSDYFYDPSTLVRLTERFQLARWENRQTQAMFGVVICVYVTALLWLASRLVSRRAAKGASASWKSQLGPYLVFWTGAVSLYFSLHSVSLEHPSFLMYFMMVYGPVSIPMEAFFLAVFPVAAFVLLPWSGAVRHPWRLVRWDKAAACLVGVGVLVGSVAVMASDIGNTMAGTNSYYYAYWVHSAWLFTGIAGTAVVALLVFLSGGLAPRREPEAPHAMARALTVAFFTMRFVTVCALLLLIGCRGAVGYYRDYVFRTPGAAVTASPADVLFGDIYRFILDGGLHRRGG